MTFTFYLTLAVFLCLCAIFALLILIQKGRGGGISSAFGGAGGNTAFGSKTGDVLTWATSVVFLLFLTFCVGLNLMAAKVNQQMTGSATPGANESTEAALPTSRPADSSAGEPTRADLPAPALPIAEQPNPVAPAAVATPVPATTMPVQQ